MLIENTNINLLWNLVYAKHFVTYIMFCQDLCRGNWDWSFQKHSGLSGFLKFFHCLLFTYPGSVYTVYEQMPQPVFFLCTVCHYMIHTYNTDSLLSLISVLIAKTTDYTPCRPLRLSEAQRFQRGWGRGGERCG